MVKARKATTKEDIDRLVVGGAAQGSGPSSATSEKAEEASAAKVGATAGAFQSSLEVLSVSDQRMIYHVATLYASICPAAIPMETRRLM